MKIEVLALIFFVFFLGKKWISLCLCAFVVKVPAQPVNFNCWNILAAFSAKGSMRSGERSNAYAWLKKWRKARKRLSPAMRFPERMFVCPAVSKRSRCQDEPDGIAMFLALNDCFKTFSIPL